MQAIAQVFPGVYAAQPSTLATVTQPQQVQGEGFQIHSVDRDGDQWQVDFQAGGRMYRYRTTHADQSLQVCDGAQFVEIATGPQTPVEVSNVLYSMAGLGIGFYSFRWGYEQWHAGRVSGWCECDEQSRAGICF